MGHRVRRENHEALVAAVSQLERRLAEETTARVASEQALQLLWAKVQELDAAEAARTARERERAAIVIQSGWRGARTRATVAPLRMETKAASINAVRAAVRIQRAWRSACARRRQELVARLAAVETELAGLRGALRAVAEAIDRLDTASRTGVSAD
jgi:hypothetical protein